MEKIILLDAGHSLTDPGAVSGGVREAELNARIRDALIPELQRNGFAVQVVPDNLNLTQSINWVNQRAKSLNDGLALAIHCNAGGGTGAECFYYGGDNQSKAMCEKLINEYCTHTGFRNRGAKPDTASAAKRLGWIRDTKPWSLLIECGFVDSEEDVKKLKDYNNIAKGICKGICKIYGVSYYEPTPPQTSPEPLQCTKELETINNLQKEINALKDQIKADEALIIQLRQEKDEISNALNNANEKIRNLNTAKSEVETKNKELKVANQNLVEQLKETENLKVSLLSCETEKKELKETLEGMQASYDIVLPLFRDYAIVKIKGRQNKLDT